MPPAQGQVQAQGPGPAQKAAPVPAVSSLLPAASAPPGAWLPPAFWYPPAFGVLLGLFGFTSRLLLVRLLIVRGLILSLCRVLLAVSLGGARFSCVVLPGVRGLLLRCRGNVAGGVRYGLFPQAAQVSSRDSANASSQNRWFFFISLIPHKSAIRRGAFAPLRRLFCCYLETRFFRVSTTTAAAARTALPSHSTI